MNAPRKNFFAKPQPDCDSFPFPRFSVWLDHTDRVISIPSNWEPLAALMGAPALARDSVLGRPVGWFIDDETVRECYRVMFERMRREGRAVRIAARCDAPNEPRAMQLRFVPMSAGAIECSWSFFQGATAAEVPLADVQSMQQSEHLRMCGWCRRVHLSTWQRLDVAASALGLLDHGELPLITHGICPQCSASMAVERTTDLRRLAVV